MAGGGIVPGDVVPRRSVRIRVSPHPKSGAFLEQWGQPCWVPISRIAGLSSPMSHHQVWRSVLKFLCSSFPAAFFGLGYKPTDQQ